MGNLVRQPVWRAAECLSSSWKRGSAARSRHTTTWIWANGESEGAVVSVVQVFEHRQHIFGLWESLAGLHEVFKWRAEESSNRYRQQMAARVAREGLLQSEIHACLGRSFLWMTAQILSFWFRNFLVSVTCSWRILSVNPCQSPASEVPGGLLEMLARFQSWAGLFMDTPVIPCTTSVAREAVRRRINCKKSEVPWSDCQLVLCNFTLRSCQKVA